MGFFNRQKHPDGPATGTTGHKISRNHHGDNQAYYSMATRPSFGQWLKYTWLDIVTMICMGAIGLGVSSSCCLYLEFPDWHLT